VQIADVIQSTGIHKLDFISAGTTPPNPAELLDGTVMRDLILDLRQTYDTVILDAPPLLAVTDSSILTALCDEVIVVIHAGGVKVKAAQRVVELLESSQAPVVGFVMNDKEGKSAAYYSSYGYGYGYGYGEDLPEPKKSLWARIFKG
jgi:tyrosine-protein kinase Etk/Wzc